MSDEPGAECGIGSEEFLRRVQAKDPDALAELAAKAGPPMLARIRSLVRDQDDVMDCFQDCWLHIMGQLDKCDQPESIVGWCVIVTGNHCKSLLRRRKQEPEMVGLSEVQDIADVRLIADQELERRTVRRAVADALELLPPRQREAVTLTLLEERSEREAAAIMNVTRRTIGQLVEVGVIRLQAQKGLRKLFQEMQQ